MSLRGLGSPCNAFNTSSLVLLLRMIPISAWAVSHPGRSPVTLKQYFFDYSYFEMLFNTYILNGEDIKTKIFINNNNNNVY